MNEVFKNISKIIERDSKSTTYKFALLRGVIDIIQYNSPYIQFENDRVSIPTGLLIEKWLLYYYPILESSIRIPQINGSSNLAFEVLFHKIIVDYSTHGGFSVFYNDLKNKGIPQHLIGDFLQLIRKMNDTITKMPMKYIGRSVSSEYYSIFKYENNRTLEPNGKIDVEYLINRFGSFSLPKEYYEAFRLLGSFINGQDSILFKWAEFSVNASNQQLNIEKVLNDVLKSPVTKRDVDESKQLYRSLLAIESEIYCVWTGELLSGFDVDHVIPFSIWKNNDLWNLLPSLASINNRKRDKIPSPKLIEKRKDQILFYWNLIHQHQTDRFQKEIQVSLLGNHSFEQWKDVAIKQLQNSCHYLINNRGYQEWRI